MPDLPAVRRGDALGADIGFGHHYYVIISNDARNSYGHTFLGARLTSRDLYAGLATTAALSEADGARCRTLNGDPMRGWVLADRIVEIPPPTAYLPAEAPLVTLHHCGSLTPQTMTAVDAALKIAIF